MNTNLCRRAIAYGIDFSIEFILFTLLMIGIGGLSGSEANFVLFSSVIAFIFLFVYYPTKHNGKTFGKMLIHVQAENTYGYISTFVREFVFKFMFGLLLVPCELIQICFYYFRNHNTNNIRLLHDQFLAG